MILQIVLLVAGFALLVKGADIFVDSSVGIAEKLKIPSFIIGLTIVAMGTSAPEAVISITASARGSNELAVGNIVGSNIFNLIFIIGLCAIIKPMVVNVANVHKDFWTSIIAAGMLLVLKFIGGDEIPRLGSAVLLAMFAIYMFFLLKKAFKLKDNPDEENPTEKPAKKPRSMPLLILFALCGLGLIIFGGHITVENATEIAHGLGISERMIAITVVAIGTSLPELITSLVACKKGENEFALGNIIGSNVFNILFILGIAGIVRPLAIDPNLIFDTIFLVATSTLALIFVYTRKRLARGEGIVLVFLYLAYMTWAVISEVAG